jgi:hypothetical protein
MKGQSDAKLAEKEGETVGGPSGDEGTCADGGIDQNLETGNR